MQLDQENMPPRSMRRSSIRKSMSTFFNESNLFSSTSFCCITPTEEFVSRVGEAARACFVATVGITSLILPGKTVFPSPWLGSVLGMRSLRNTLGDTVLATKQVFVPLLPVAGVGKYLSTFRVWGNPAVRG